MNIIPLKSGPKPRFCIGDDILLCKQGRRKAIWRKKKLALGIPDKKNKPTLKKRCEKCLICFETKRDEQKYCSKLCFLKRNNFPRKYCVICNKPFYPQTIKTMCCGLACSSIKAGRTLHKRKYDYPPNLTDREKSNFRQNINRNERYKTDTKFRLNSIMRLGIYSALIENSGSKGRRSWKTLVDFTVDDLIKHLEKKFQPNMSWENYGEWHIDHIIPISAFNFSDAEHGDFKKCWCLDNLQPMWASENFSKGNKLDKHFQPGLEI